MATTSIHSASSRIALLTGTALFGVTAIGGAAAQSISIPEITITAHQVPLESSRVGAAVTVLQGDDLRARGIPNVATALRDVPGVDVTESGTAGSLTQVRIRGADANHVLVLVDDVPMNRLDAGDFDFANFGIEAIERIEVLRGPQSGLYGSNAQAGVISIVTKSGRGEKKPVVEAWGEYGSRGTRSAAGNVRGQAGPFYGSITVQNMNTDGHNIARTGTERDDHRARTLTGKAGIDFNEHFNVEGTIRQVDRAVQYDQEQFPPGDPPVVDSFAYDKFNTTSGRLAATLKLFNDRWVQRASWSLLSDTYASDFGFGFIFRTFGKRERMDYRSSYTFDTAALGGARHTVSAQIEKEREHFDNNVGADKDRGRKGAAGEYLVDFPFGLTLSGAVRKDWNEQFADAQTWRATANQRFPQTGTRLHASAGTGVTNPTFVEQFGASFNFVGNPALTPERSFGWDAGVEQTFWNGRAVLDVTYFAADVTDQIVPGTINGQNTAVNAAGVSLRKGVEAGGKVTIFDWLKLAGSYTYLDATRPDGTPEPRRSPHSATGSVTVLFDSNRGRLTGSFRYNARREDRAFITFGDPTRVILPAYHVVAAILSYDVNKRVNVYARAENLFNTGYEEIYSYRAAPFGAFAGLRIKMAEQ